MYRGRGVFIKYGVAARGFYMYFNFVNVLLVVKYDGGVAFVSRKESKLGSLFIKDFKAERCLGVRLSGVLSCLGLKSARMVVVW